jgi:hypothetical protein
MKKFYLTFIMLAAVVLTFTACKKYDEGPAFSLASKKARFVNNWKVEKILYDGVEQNLTTDDQESRFNVKKDGTFDATSSGSGYSGKWEFSKDKESFYTEVEIGSISFKDTIGIVRLKSKELWTRETTYNHTSETHYIPAE